MFCMYINFIVCDILLSQNHQVTYLPEKVSCTSHNALLPMGYFEQVVIWGDSDERHLSYNKTSQSFFFR